MKSISCLWLHFFLFFLLILNVVRPVYATQVNFTGTLRSNPPCTINDGENILVNFGDVGISQIDGTRYARTFTLNILCTSDLGNGVVLYFAYDGMTAGFDNDALQTSRTNLGIKLYRGEQAVIVPPDNTNHAVTMSGGVSLPLTLTAIPVKDPAPTAVLYEGPFTAIGTVEIRYP